MEQNQFNQPISQGTPPAAQAAGQPAAPAAPTAPAAGQHYIQGNSAARPGQAVTPPYGYAPGAYPYPGGQYPQYPPVYAQKKPKKKLPTGIIVFICVLAVAVAFGFGVMVHSVLTAARSDESAGGKNPSAEIEQYDSLNDNALKPGVDSGNNDLKIKLDSETGKEMSTSQIAESSRNSVLGISVYSTSGILEGEASGVVAGTNSKNTKTYIITCAHVVDEDKNYVYKIVDAAGKEYLAAVVGYDSSRDIGVLSVEKVGFDAVRFADSSTLKAGETVVAIGNPGGSEFFGSVTQGVVSATDRMLSFSSQNIKCIQHDAAINPGSSGGALYNQYGQVVGINYSKIAMDDYEGMNFAVPSNTVVERANIIIAEGLKTRGARLGIEYYVAASYFDENYKQLIINSIDEKSDLKGKAVEGDFIIAVNGEKITDKYTIIELINGKSPGDTITLTIAHKNEKTDKYDTKDVEVKLIEK